MYGVYSVEVRVPSLSLRHGYASQGKLRQSPTRSGRRSFRAWRTIRWRVLFVINNEISAGMLRKVPRRARTKAILHQGILYMDMSA